MDIHTKIRKCLKKWMSDLDLWKAMVFLFDYTGSPTTLSRERRKVSGLIERYVANKNGILYKQFKWSK